MKKGFSTIMSAQFFSSLADNALLVAAVELLRMNHAPSWQTPALAPMFALFYVVLAPFVGTFADSIPKGKVMFVSNLIKVGDIPTPADVKARIMAAFKRQAGLDASGVSVTTEGSTVTLRGRVKAWGERRMAELAAWSAPGVTDVEDYLAVDS